MRLWELMEMKPRKLLTGELRIPEKVEVVPAGYVRQKLQNKTVTPGPARQVVLPDYYINGTIAEIDEENVAADREIPWGVTLEKGLDYNIVAVLNQDRDDEIDDDFTFTGDTESVTFDLPSGHARIIVTRTGISVDPGANFLEASLVGSARSHYSGLGTVTVEPIPADYVKMPAGYASASKVIFTKTNGVWTGAIAND